MKKPTSEYARFVRACAQRAERYATRKPDPALVRAACRRLVAIARRLRALDSAIDPLDVDPRAERAVFALGAEANDLAQALGFREAITPRKDGELLLGLARAFLASDLPTVWVPVACRVPS